MTSFRQPDYDVGLKVSRASFRAIAGTAFNATITFGEDMQCISGMLIVPQGNAYPDSSDIATAWLWSEKHTDALENTKVKITLGEPCDPMLSPEEKAAFATQTDVTLEGVITRNWNS